MCKMNHSKLSCMFQSPYHAATSSCCGKFQQETNGEFGHGDTLSIKPITKETEAGGSPEICGHPDLQSEFQTRQAIQ